MKETRLKRDGGFSVFGVVKRSERRTRASRLLLHTFF